MSDDLKEIETKLSAARTRLILEKPFLGALVMHLPLVAADPKWCQTTASDAKAFYYNADYIRSLNLSQTQFMLSHEALHCALGHFARRNHRDIHRWGVACDHAVNLLLMNEGLKPPPGALHKEIYRDLTAEEIYPLIKYDTSEQTLDRHIYDGDPGGDAGKSIADPQAHEAKQSEHAESKPENQDQQGAGAGEQNTENEPEHQGKGKANAKEQQDEKAQSGEPEPAELSESEKEELEVQWKNRLATAAQQAKQAGKLGDSFARIIDHLLQPQLPWRMLLARYMKTIARDDYSFQRPSRREGEAIMPSLHSGEVDVIAVIDTSGSIGEEEMQEFLSEVDVIKAQMRARITLHACDHQLASNGPWLFESWEPIQLPSKMMGGGGTSFVPIFEWISTQHLRPDLLVYFTDAEGEFPESEPDFPVLWLVKGKGKVPWGQRVQLN